MAKFSNPDHTMIEVNGKFIPVDPSNADYRQLIDMAVSIDPYVPAPLVTVVPNSVAKIALVRVFRIVGLDGNPANPIKAWPLIKAALAQAPEEVQEDWELSTRIPRSHPALAGIAAGFSVPSEVLDAAFIMAEQVDVAS